MEIWINPACSKCRARRHALDEAGAEYTVRRYLDDPPTTRRAREVLARLGLEPWDITRLGEPSRRSSALKRRARRTRRTATDWLDGAGRAPELIQRPIITADDGTAVVGPRPRDPVARIVDRRGAEVARVGPCDPASGQAPRPASSRIATPERTAARRQVPVRGAARAGTHAHARRGPKASWRLPVAGPSVEVTTTARRGNR